MMVMPKKVTTGKSPVGTVASWARADGPVVLCWNEALFNLRALRLPASASGSEYPGLSYRFYPRLKAPCHKPHGALQSFHYLKTHIPSCFLFCLGSIRKAVAWGPEDIASGNLLPSLVAISYVWLFEFKCMKIKSSKLRVSGCTGHISRAQ